MATLSDLTDDQLMVYAGMLEEKGRNIRLEINRKIERIHELTESYLALEQQEQMRSVLLPAFDQSIQEKVNMEITADAVIAITAPTQE